MVLRRDGVSIPAKKCDPMDEIRSMASMECGKEIASQFAFGDGFLNLNHGSYGTYPTAIRSVLRRYQELAEERPDNFIRNQNPRFLDNSRDAVSRLLKVPDDTCVFVPNATTAFNTILRNLEFKTGDVIIYFATIYHSCQDTVNYITDTTPVESQRIPYTYPVSDEYLCTALEDTIHSIRSSGKNPRLAHFDTIVSLPGVRMPFERLTQLCRKLNVPSCIDGAHSIGHIPMDLTKLDPDYYFSNLYKWLHVPRGCCVLYVPKRNQKYMRTTLPTTHPALPRPEQVSSTAKNTWVSNFDFVGATDNSPYLCVPAAIEWRSKVFWNGLKGEEAIICYNMWLSKEAGKKSASILGTHVMENKGSFIHDCAFSNVALPLSAKEIIGGDFGQAGRIVGWITQVLIDEYDTFMAVYFHGDKWWLRISAQIYLTIEDFEWGARILSDICERVKAGEWR